MLTVLCFSCDLQRWHPATGRLKGRECLSLEEKPKTQKILKKKKKFLQIDFYLKPERKAPKREGNSFGFLFTATWDTQKGQRRLVTRREDFNGLA